MRNVIVTGGSRGLGLGIARRLAASGYAAIAIARRKTEAVSAATEEAKRGGTGALHFVPFDLAAIDKIPDLVRKLRKDFGPIYGLINNAALGTDGVLATMHNSKIEALIRVNTVSPIVLTKYVVRNMMADGGGRIVNIGSVIGFTGYSGLSVYGASKSAMTGFTRSLAREVGRAGITVNAIAPGFMATEMTKQLDDDQREQVARRSALRRLPEPEDVARTVEFLLGEGGRNISGTTITVDAGATA